MFQFQRFKVSNFYFQVIFSNGTVQQIYVCYFFKQFFEQIFSVMCRDNCKIYAHVKSGEERLQIAIFWTISCIFVLFFFLFRKWCPLLFDLLEKFWVLDVTKWKIFFFKKKKDILKISLILYIYSKKNCVYSILKLKIWKMLIFQHYFFDSCKSIFLVNILIKEIQLIFFCFQY